MMIGMGLFWLVVVLGLVWLLRRNPDQSQPQQEETALTTLDRRFAEGAVSLDEYRHRRDVLTRTAVRARPRT